MTKYLVLGIIVMVWLILFTTSNAAPLVQSGGPWGYLPRPIETKVYRLKDSENGATCYFAFYTAGGAQMSCVK